MLSLLTKIFGTANDRLIKKYNKEISTINSFEESISQLSNIELKNKTKEFRRKLKKGTKLVDIKHEAFAVVREASKRALKMRHFDVQLIGGLVLNDGNITEMRTGEGKTLVATLAAYLNALEGDGVHIVTVNDYLAKRDANMMGKLYNFLGLSCSFLISNMDDEDRKKAYESDILYATNNELGFDYLKDNMKFTKASKVQKSLNYAIVDEVDSILIDEARTPLIISGPVDTDSRLNLIINNLVKQLDKSHFTIDEKSKSITLTDDGINAIEKLLLQNALVQEQTSLYDYENLSLVHYINQALRAHHIFQKDVDYIIQNQKIMIIDEFTGRVMDGRRYSDGLHQALEAKENVPVQRENQTLASITFQNFFRGYKKLSGMTGTAMTEAAEFKDIYNLDVISVPTHKKTSRIDHDDEIYGSAEEKNSAVLKQILACHEKGQPILVGTVSIEKSEQISKDLDKKGIKHNVLNAKMHEKEAYIIAQAGRFRAVTIATNMAGRGTDIVLGGNIDMLIDDIKDSLNEDKLNAEIDRIMQKTDLEKQDVIKAGGLFVLATERHESRRIDNQLRGRSGRQGDPGETKFFLSLEDDLMRIFASDRISGVLRTLGLKNGEAIQHPMISKSLEKAQQKVEAHNYEIRKNLLRFDDVMNDQRKIIYQQRNEVIDTDNVIEFRESMLQFVAKDAVAEYIKPGSYREDWDVEGLCKMAFKNFAIKITPKDIEDIEGAEEEITEGLIESVRQLMLDKEDVYGDHILKVLEKSILLETLDGVWKEHLHALDHLRQGIQLRAYGQKDPLNEYKREAFALFEQMLYRLKSAYIQKLCLFHLDMQHLDRYKFDLEQKRLQEMHESKQDIAFNNYNAGSSQSTKARPVQAHIAPEKRDPNDPSSWGKISRNEPCPCKSGKKYKHCHG